MEQFINKNQFQITLPTHYPECPTCEVAAGRIKLETDRPTWSLPPVPIKVSSIVIACESPREKTEIRSKAMYGWLFGTVPDGDKCGRYFERARVVCPGLINQELSLVNK